MRMVVNIDVDDLQRAVDFYTAGLGLCLGRYLFDGSVAELHGASSTIHLLSKPAGSAAAATGTAAALRRDYARHWTPVHLDFEVDDIAAAVQRAVGAGARLEGRIESFAWGRLARIGDPFGHGCCLLQFTGAGYDAAA